MSLLVGHVDLLYCCAHHTLRVVHSELTATFAAHHDGFTSAMSQSASRCWDGASLPLSLGGPGVAHRHSNVTRIFLVKLGRLLGDREQRHTAVFARIVRAPNEHHSAFHLEGVGFSGAPLAVGQRL